MKKLKCMVIFYGILFLTLLPGCGKAAPNINQIKQDIPIYDRYIYIDGEPYLLELESLDIVKRQTDEREDEVWCSFVMSDNVYRLEGEWKFKYEYYDEGGWMLENNYMSDETLTILSEDIPESLEKYTTQETFHYHFSPTNAMAVPIEYKGISGAYGYYRVEYNIHNEKECCIDQGTYCIDLTLEKKGDRKYDWEYEETIDMETVWKNIVGVYKTKVYTISIDSFDEQTNEIHIDEFRKGEIELSDLVTIGVERNTNYGSRLLEFELQKTVDEKLKNEIIKNDLGLRYTSIDAPYLSFDENGRVYIDGYSEAEKIEN